jgi:hypothetical protein
VRNVRIMHSRTLIRDLQIIRGLDEMDREVRLFPLFNLAFDDMVIQVTVAIFSGSLFRLRSVAVFSSIHRRSLLCFDSSQRRRRTLGKSEAKSQGSRNHTNHSSCMSCPSPSSRQWRR